MNRKKVSRNIKPAALWALRQSGSKNFIVVAPLLQNDVDVFIKDAGTDPVLSKRDAGLKTDYQKGANWGFLTSVEALITSLRTF